MNNTTIINEKFGYVENVEYECLYKNIDYRDTTVPLWHELHSRVLNQLKNTNELNELNKQLKEQNEINLALCASIIQLGKLKKHNVNNLYTMIKNMEDKIENIESKLNINKSY